jgi:hypothetical protein
MNDPTKHLDLSDPANAASLRLHVDIWVKQERKHYADVKYAEDQKGRQDLISDTTNFPNFDGPEGTTWITFLTNYLGRAQRFGVNTPQGRQQLGKLIATATHCLETAVMVHGRLPKPGVPSGEIEEWT